MKKIVMFAAAGAALALSACGGGAGEAPAADTAAEETMPAEGEAVTDETADALDAAAEAAEGTEMNGNPIGPAAPGNPVGPAAPAAESAAE